MARVCSTLEEQAVVNAVNSLTRFSWSKFEKEQSLARARSNYRKARAAKAPRVAVAGFNMSINAAGRAQALADIHAAFCDTTLIGFLHDVDGGDIWEPLATTSHPFLGIRVSQPNDLPSVALEFVLANPFDIVHLSKSRFCNVLLGALYKVIWGSTVFVDVDDEDLGVARQTMESLDLTQFLKKNRTRRRQWRQLVGSDGARVGARFWDAFDGVTVSNPALQEKYGGLIVPHARLASQFKTSDRRKADVRKEFQIPDAAFVFLFFGTARRHKGVLETAEIIAQVNRAGTMFVVAGSVDDDLRSELEAVEGLDLRILPVQPYDRIPEIVGMADACVLLQAEDSLLAQFQLPAKLIDALAMEIMVFLSPTPAVQNVIDAGCALPASHSDMPRAISEYLDAQSEHAEIRKNGRDFFVKHLSVEACSPALKKYVGDHLAQDHRSDEIMPDRLRFVLEAIGGWSALRGNRFQNFVAGFSVTEQQKAPAP